MTEFNNNNKYISKAPEQYIVAELKDQQTKKSSLSAAARSKVINRSGSNYLSESREGYGPCFKSFSNECNCGFMITATLVDVRGNARSETIFPTSEQQVRDLARRINLGQGEWENGFEDDFRPDPDSRGALSMWVKLSVSPCGPQRITVVEGRNFTRKATINGITM